MASRSRPGRRAHGFSYLVMLIALAIFGVGLGVAVPMWSTQVRIEREAALMDSGRTLVRALRAYAAYGSSIGTRYPQHLSDLLEDRRSGVLHRYLRSIPVDPMTHEENWGLVTGDDGGIRGVYSLSAARPMRDATPEDVSLQGDGSRYSDWHFRADAPLDKAGGR